MLTFLYGRYKKLQGVRAQNGFLHQALTERNTQVRFDLKVVLKLRDVDILIIETSFHELLTVRNLSIGPDVNQHSFQFQFFFRIFFFDSDLLRTKKNQKCHKFYILIDFSGIRNLSSLNDLNSLSGLNELNSFISSKHLLSLNAGTKMTYPGLSM